MDALYVIIALVGTAGFILAGWGWLFVRRKRVEHEEQLEREASRLRRSEAAKAAHAKKKMNGATQQVHHHGDQE